jgi:hypothetical protein
MSIHSAEAAEAAEAKAPDRVLSPRKQISSSLVVAELVTEVLVEQPLLD